MENSKLEPPEKFEFPFTPYDIQHNFMGELYRTIEERKLGIFESPTGTGKSLSIICGALRWLKDHNQRERDQLQAQMTRLQQEKEKLAADTADWLTSQAQELEVTRRLNQLKIENNKILDYDKKIEKMRGRKKIKVDRSKYVNLNKKEKMDDKSSGTADETSQEMKDVVDEDEILIEDALPDVQDLSEEEEEDEDQYSPVKIYICSRTHSQLSQLVGEIKKSPHGSDIRTVSLASRQNYCINPSVSRLKNVHLINERCLDMQKNKSKATKKDEEGKVAKRQRGTNCKCPYYKQVPIEELRDSALTEIQDVEDLVTTGKVFKACPYYASRKAAQDGQVILVPYNTILHRATREANGIKLKDNVVIIDEAHNLLEALAQMYSSELKYDQLFYAHQQLKNYKSKYSTRFSSYNLLCINQLLFVISRLKDLLSKDLDRFKKDDSNTTIYTVQNFVTSAEIDNYNMYKLIKFSRDSKIYQKLHSFATKFPTTEEAEEKPVKKGLKNFLASIENKKSEGKRPDLQNKPEMQNNSQAKPAIVPSNPLLAVISFLEALTCSYGDGRIIMHSPEEKRQRKLQFLLLNPASQFEDVVKEARAVVVAGGTMKPTLEFKDRLFKAAGGEPGRIVEFSCDHIIPPENILPIVMGKGPKGESLLFNFESRFSMGNSLKLIIQEACKKVRGGIVVFFPSYKYEAWLWQQLKDVTFGRPVFREPQDSGSVESVLDAYAEAVRKHKASGALLFSVVGGKLSEGLNFSDELGRCVVVVGMPYANICSPDLKEKMAYLEKVEGSGAGQRFYEGLCMKAVNQCIGRAVRHQSDYASVLLVDERYNRMSTKNGLPGWIRRSLKTGDFREAFASIDKFFLERNGQ